MRDNDVRECPHCGGHSTLKANYSKRSRSSGWFIFVQRDVCGARGKTYFCEEDPEDVEWNNTACCGAVEAWNMRFSQFPMF